MVGGWAYHAVVCRDLTYENSTLSCLQAVHEVCVDRGSPLVLSCAVRGSGRGCFGRTSDYFASFSRSLGKATSRPYSWAFLSGISGCSGVTYVGRPWDERALLCTGVPDIVLSSASLSLRGSPLVPIRRTLQFCNAWSPPRPTQSRCKLVGSGE